MTPEAKIFRDGGIQTMRTRMLDPRYSVWRMASTLRTDSDAPNCMFWRDMMLVGSLLGPEPAMLETGETPAFYLDSAEVRSLISRELAIPPRLFLNNCDVNSWAGLIPDGSVHRRELRLDRRFYVINRTGFFGWYAVPVPTQAEKNAEGSTIGADSIVMPTFEAVTDAMRYAAMGM